MDLNQSQWNQLRLNRILAEYKGGDLGLKMHDAAAIAEAQERARIRAQTPAQHSEPAPTEAMPAPVVAESTEQRRARWLDSYGKGERGAVERVYKLELLLNPKADRSYIGKQIELAKSERKTAKNGDAMYSQLYLEGKHVT
jgi:hypothetical protein